MTRSARYPSVLVAGALALHAPALAGQSTGGGRLSFIQAGLGAGAGTGRFGGPGVGLIVQLVPATRPLAFGGEVTAVFRREHYAEGGLGGVGRRTRLGGLAVTPRVDLLVHAGHGLRATGLLGATLGGF